MFQWLKRFRKQLRGQFRGTSVSGLSEYEPDPVQRAPADTFYGRNPWLFITVKRVAQAASMLPIRVVNRNGTELPDSDPAVQFLRNPAGEMPGHVFWLFMFSWLSLKGDAYAFMNFEDTDLMSEVPPERAPSELIVWPASKVRPLEVSSDPIRNVEGYRLSSDKAQIDIHASRMLHVRDFSPVSWYQGTGAGEAANTSLWLDEWSQRWNTDGFKHGGSHMRMLFLIKYALQNDDLKERTRQQLEEQFAGVGNTHKPILVDAETEARPYGNTHQDMEFGELRKANRDEIAAAVGVPPAKVGILEHSNYANMDQQDLIFWEGTMKPVLRLMESYANTVLLPRFGRRDHRMVFDTREVRVLRENLSETITSVSTMIQYGLATPNEGIAILRAQGMTELRKYDEGGDEHYINNGLVRVEDKQESEELEPMMQQDEQQATEQMNGAIEELISSSTSENGEQSDER